MSNFLNGIEALGRYTLIRELGRGGMSVVYLAKDTELGREVVVKCVDTSNNTVSKMANSLRSEAKLLAQLNHTNIVQLYDVVEQDNTLGLVIEYAGGNTLTQRLKHMPSKAIKLKWLAEIAAGLANAHNKGIAHCDLKADNILITHDNIAKIADFGIAKAKRDDYLEDDGLTRLGSVTGSYFSLSPEQASGQAVDTRTDLFSFGVLMYQTLMKKHPFGDIHNKTAMLQRVIGEPFFACDSDKKVLGVRLSEVLNSTLKKDPSERIYNALEIADLIKSEFLSNNTDLESYDTTRTIPIQTKSNNTTINPLKKNIGRLAFIASGFLVAAILIYFTPFSQQTQETVSYIALDHIDVSIANDVSPTLAPLIKNTLQQSSEATILSFKETGLVNAKELNSIDGNFSKKAQASGVKNILVLSAHCGRKKCDIKIQKRSGKLMAVSEQTNFPIASDSLLNIQDAVASQIPKLFDQTYFIGSLKKSLNENEYRRYLEIYTASSSGVSIDETHFNNTKQLILESPNFKPAYTLLSQLGSYLFQNSSDEDYLISALNSLKKAPNKVKVDKNFSKTKIQLLLNKGELTQADEIYKKLSSEVNDKLFLSEIESAIASEKGDYDALLRLDRQNAIWRPSVNNLYNLATSEFLIGNHHKANDLVSEVLKVSPKDTYALDLKAGIEMSLGHLPKALKTYKDILKNNQDSSAYTNYGIAQTLSKNYEGAVESHKKAIEINPKEPLHYLNLADAHNLAHNDEMASRNYAKVGSLVQNPNSVQEFSYLAQSQAHLKQYNLAVKTLKVANKKFPNVAELDYAASIINTLAGNYVAAVVDVNDAIINGTATVWFSMEWFKPLCGYEGFKDITQASTAQICND